VVGNLTTVSTSPRDFTTTILGYYFAERIAAAEGGDGDLNIFLRWEQLAAHARFRVNGDGRLRGIERVRKCANEGDAITLCADARGQILSNQKTYGLWGLYTGPARASGLVEGSPTRLTAAGRKLVESLYLPLFTRSKLRDANEVVSKLTKPLTVLQAAGKDSLFLERVGAVLVPELSAAERATFRHHLLLGAEPNRTEGRQEIVVDALEETIADEEWGFAAPRLRHMAKRCRASGAVGSEAARRLERIRAAEQVLAPAAALFDLILGADGQTVGEVASAVRRAWGPKLTTIDADETRELEAELRDATADPASGRRWVSVAEALSQGEYGEAVLGLMEQNAFVMKSRAGAGAWADLSDGKIRVRYRDDNLGNLPTRQELATLWQHSYFLDALRTMAVELRA